LGVIGPWNVVCEVGVYELPCPQAAIVVAADPASTVPEVPWTAVPTLTN
jgi:hypothetical protein